MVDKINRCGATAIISILRVNFARIHQQKIISITPLSKKHYPCRLHYNPTDNEDKSSERWRIKQIILRFFENEANGWEICKQACYFSRLALSSQRVMLAGYGEGWGRTGEEWKKRLENLGRENPKNDAMNFNNTVGTVVAHADHVTLQHRTEE